MRKIICLVCLLLVVNFGFAQEETEIEVETIAQVQATKKPKVFIKVDTTLYSKTYLPPHDNGYWSEDGKAFLRAGYRPQAYKDFKEYMNTEISGFEIIESKEIEIEGIKFLYQKMEQNRDGTMVHMVSYIKRHNQTSVIEVGGFFSKGTELIYKSAIENAAISAKLIEE